MKPLNEELYNRLASVFGDVRICSEGEPFVASTRKRAIMIPGKRDKYLDVVNPGEYYAVCCPICGDTRNRLWVNHMWNVGYNGMSLKYMIRCYNESCDELPDFRETFEELLKPDSIYSVVSPPDPDAVAKFINDYPGETVSLTELPKDHKVIHYLETERGFNTQELSEIWGIRWVTKPNHELVRDTNRLVIPVFGVEDGEEKILAWQTRWYDYHKGNPRPPSKKIPKYLIQGPTRLLPYNLHRTKKNFIIICEGVFDAIRVGVDHGVCTFGKTLSNRQANLIEDRVIASGGYVIFAYDPDVESKQWARIQARVKDWPGTRYLNFPPGVDIADYTQEQIDELVKGFEDGK